MHVYLKSLTVYLWIFAFRSPHVTSRTWRGKKVTLSCSRRVLECVLKKGVVYFQPCSCFTDPSFDNSLLWVQKDLEEVRKANPAQSRWIYVALWKAIYTSTTRRWFPDFNLPVMQPRSGAPESARQAVFLQVYLSALVWHTHTHTHMHTWTHTYRSLTQPRWQPLSIKGSIRCGRERCSPVAKLLEHFWSNLSHCNIFSHGGVWRKMIKTPTDSSLVQRYHSGNG